MEIASHQLHASDSKPWGGFRATGFARVLLALSRYTPLGRGISRKKLFAAFVSQHAGPVDVKIWGTRVRLHPANNVSERKALMRPDRVDCQEHELLRSAMRRPGSIFIDIGGNAGLYSLSAALHAGENSRIFMIEPDPNLIQRFLFNLTEARRAGLVRATIRVTPTAVAISDINGSGTLSTTSEEGSRGLIDGVAGAGLTVPLIPLSQLVHDNGIEGISVMKIDVEGHEDRVLPPFFESTREELWPRLVIIEHLQRATWKQDCIAMALERGYSVALMTRNNTLLTRG